MGEVMRVGLSILSLLLVATPIQAQSARDVARRTFPSVVLLVTEDAQGQPRSLGSGFFIRPGIVATNLHVIRGAARAAARVIGDSRRLSVAGVVALDSIMDLALLAIPEARAPVLSLADSRSLSVGDVVYAVGNPEGLEGTFSQGIVSGIRRVRADTLLQITAPISPGSSGGPILNATGGVVGVAVATFTEGQNLNFAVPSVVLTRLLRRVGQPRPLSSAPAPKPQDVTDSELGPPATEGVTITHVEEGVSWTSFSVRNHLTQAVSHIDLLLIFYDYNREPVHTERTVLFTNSWEAIPAGLARSTVLTHLAVRLNQGWPRVEFRVLNYQIER